MVIVKNATQAFEMYYAKIKSEGIDTNVGTKALYDVTIEMTNPLDNIISTEWRKFSTKYAEREFNWYMSGNPSVEELQKYAPIWGNMHNGNFIVQSNYGWQWGRNKQLEKCISQLIENKYTRQAWISIFDGKEKDNYDFDTPCTLSVGFSVTPNTDNLNMTVLMRSNDLIYGFCNDQYCFSKLLAYVADRTNMRVGKYIHYAHDLHIYNHQLNLKEKYYEKINKKA